MLLGFLIPTIGGDKHLKVLSSENITLLYWSKIKLFWRNYNSSACTHLREVYWQENEMSGRGSSGAGAELCEWRCPAETVDALLLVDSQ